MKKLLWIFFAALAMACGDGSGSAERDDREAATEEDVDIGSGEEISPQLELDSSETRFEVDSISSADETKKEDDRE